MCRNRHVFRKEETGEASTSPVSIIPVVQSRTFSISCRYVPGQSKTICMLEILSESFRKL
jgi:hypothetical protein